MSATTDRISRATRPDYGPPHPIVQSSAWQNGPAPVASKQPLIPTREPPSQRVGEQEAVSDLNVICEGVAQPLTPSRHPSDSLVCWETLEPP